MKFSINYLEAYEYIRKYTSKCRNDCDRHKKTECSYMDLCRMLSIPYSYFSRKENTLKNGCDLRPWEQIPILQQDLFKKVFLEWLITK